MVCGTRSRNEGERMMGATSMRRVFEEREEGRKIAFDSENCRDRGERGGQETQTVYKNTKTFYRPENYPCIDVPRYKGEKGWRVQKARMEDCRE